MAPRHCDSVMLGKRKAPLNNYKVTEVRTADIIQDVSGQHWRLGKSIGVGAFGEIFLASDDTSRLVSSETKYVVKMEPLSSGPLFVERNFYLRVAKLQSIQHYMIRKNLKGLGVPYIYSFGSCEYRKKGRMRFIVLPKFGASIQSLLEKYNNKFHIKTAFTIALHIIDSLEYIHEQGYIHADIKAANMVLSHLNDPSNSAPVHLIDYGLAARYKNRDGSHNEFVQDIRTANAGTQKFSSRDSHKGVICRRSDIESLGYCLVDWLGGCLPWDECPSNPQVVEDAKEKAMRGVNGFLSSAFHGGRLPDGLLNYFTYVTSLDFTSRPDYAYLKKLLQNSITRAGFRSDMKVTFQNHAKLHKSACKRIAERENIAPPKRIRFKSSDDRKPCGDYNEKSGPVTRNVDRSNNFTFEDCDWARVLAGDPEKMLRKKSEKHSDDSIYDPGCSPKSSDLSNPTPAMLKLMKKKSGVESQRRYSRCHENVASSSSLTYAMEEVLALRHPPKRVLRSSSRK